MQSGASVSKLALPSSRDEGQQAEIMIFLDVTSSQVALVFLLQEYHLCFFPARCKVLEGIDLPFLSCSFSLTFLQSLNSSVVCPSLISARLWWRPSSEVIIAHMTMETRQRILCCFAHEELRLHGFLSHQILLLPIKPLTSSSNPLKWWKTNLRENQFIFPPSQLNQLQPSCNSTLRLYSDGARGYPPWHPPLLEKSYIPPLFAFNFEVYFPHPCSEHLPPAWCRQVSRQPSASSAGLPAVPTPGPEPGASVKVYQE